MTNTGEFYIHWKLLKDEDEIRIILTKKETISITNGFRHQHSFSKEQTEGNSLGRGKMVLKGTMEIPNEEQQKGLIWGYI